MSIRTKLIIALLVATVPVVAVLGYFGLDSVSHLLRVQSLRNVREQTMSLGQELQQRLVRVRGDLAVLSTSHDSIAFARACEQKPEQLLRDGLTEVFIAVGGATGIYRQVRLLDTSGRERIRVDFSKSQATVIPEDELQDKSDRYYFRTAMELAPGETYVSPLDLNRERGDIQLPYTPTIRYAAAVRDDGALVGILVLNVDGGSILPVNAPQTGEFFTVDPDGWYLSHSDAAKAWSGPRDLDTRHNLRQDFGAAAVQLLSPSPSVLEHGSGAVATWPIALDRELPDGYFVLGTRQPLDQIFENVRQFRIAFGILLAVAFALPVVAGLILGNYFMRPLGRLRDAVHSVAEGDLSTTAEVSSGDEFQRLAGDFNVMTSRLRESRKQERFAIVGRFAGDISHDIKNMLTPIQTCAQTLEVMFEDMFQDVDRALADDTVPDQAKADIVSAVGGVREFYPDAIEMLVEGSTNVQERVREIADYVKGVSGEPQLEPNDVTEVVARAIRPLALMGESAGIAVTMEASGDLPTAMVDEKRIHTAIYNLVNNALPETPAGGSITVRLSCERDGDSEGCDFLVIEVADTGRGMPEDVREKLFTEDVKSTKAGGTGLGTKIVENVVDAHHGTISVASEVGEGTTFTIRLPLHLPEA